MNAQMLLQSVAGGDEGKTYIDDVFSTYLYTGNGTSQTINNGIDLAGEGGLVWIKNRNTPQSGYGHHNLFDTQRGSTKFLMTNMVDAQISIAGEGLTVFGNSGFTVAKNVPDGNVNEFAKNYASWTFRRAPKFFDIVTYTHTNGTAKTIDLSYLGTVGFVTIKRTDSPSDWYAWHRGLTAGNNLKLNTTAAQSATNAYISVSGTTLTFSASAPSGTYVLYGWAHDSSKDGIIQCGSFRGTGLPGNSVNLGWEPQYVLIKNYDHTINWYISDAARGMAMTSDPYLFADTSGAEIPIPTIFPTATGFMLNTKGNPNQNKTNSIYLAIRRPNKPPKSGTEVYNAIARNGTGAAATVTGVGFAPDSVWIAHRNSATAYNRREYSRLRGNDIGLLPNQTNAEVTDTGGFSFSSMTGFDVGSLADINASGNNFIDYAFRRAPGFFDVVCDTGTGAAHAINHSLTVAPELIIRKSRSAATQWECWHSALAATEKLVLNSSAAKTTDATAFGTLPTATQFYVGASANTNASAATYVTYLFATCPGVSKVGYYTGNGTSLTVECGFSTGARFILAKSIDDAGDSFIWDSARGIVAANDPHLSLNTTAAEVTTDDSVDPYAGGFIVNQNTATNININGKRYIFLAIA